MQQLGRYRLLGEVARGGVGVVHRALGPDGVPVAIKVLLAGAEASAPQRRRFARELEALRRVRHPGVVAVLDAGEAQGCPYLVLEWVEGETLAARLAREGPLASGAAAELVSRLAEALAACHAQGVLHRDLKPENVLLRAGSGAPLLTDFGLSRQNERSSLTAEGGWLGTPGFWPPEQARGELAAIGPRSDVYGLGAILFAALTGQPPNPGRTLLEALEAAEREPRRPSALRPEVPAALEAICLRCLERDPAARWSDPGELAGALRAWLGAGPGAPARGTSRRGLLVGALLAPPLLAGVTLFGGREPRAETPGPAAVPVTSAAPRAGEHAGREGLDLLLAGDDARALARLELATRERPDDAGLLAGRGTARLRLGDASGARADLERALALDPRQPLARVNLPLALHVGGDSLRALELLDRSLAEGGGEETALLRARSQVRRDQDDLSGALADAERAITLGDASAEALAQRGDLRRQRGDAAGAVADLDRALELAPGELDVVHLRGLARAGAGDLQGAREDLDRWLAHDPQDADALWVRGMVRAELEDFSGALADYDTSLALAAGDGERHAARGAVRLRLGDHQAAWEDMEQALLLGVEDPGRLRMNRGVVQIQLGRYAEASGELRSAVEQAPDDADLWFLLGQATQLAGEIEASQEALGRALELDPRHAVAWATRSLSWILTGELQRAMEDAERAVATAEADERPQALLARARVHRAGLRWPEAITDADGACHEPAALPVHRLFLAQLLAEAGEAQRAEEDVRRLLALDPDWGDALVVRAGLRVKGGAHREALADLDRARALGTTEPWQLAWVTARALRGLGAPEALAALDQALELAPREPALWLERAELRAERGLLAEARQDVARGLELRSADEALRARLQELGARLAR